MSADTMKTLTEIAILTPHWSAEDEARFPDVPITEGVDLMRLTRGDPTPVFVIRPLAVEGGISDNNLKYTSDMLSEIYQQVLSKRPPARLGHVSEANRSWEVPPDSGLWVGAYDDQAGSVFGKRAIFGKCYLFPTMPLREMVVKRSAAGTQLSNSIWGLADLVENDDGTVSSQSTDIESIDFVSPERAALKALGGDFKVTSEMKENTMADGKEEAAARLKEMSGLVPEELHNVLHEAGRAHEIAQAHIRLHETGGTCTSAMSELFTADSRKKVAETHLREEATPEETYTMLSEAQRSHCAECYAKEAGKALKPMQEETKVKESMAEMTGRLSELENGVKDRDLRLAENNTRLAEMEKVIKGYQRADFERSLDVVIDGYFPAQMVTEKGKEGLGNLKRQMRKSTLAEMAGMENGQTPDNIKTACDKVWSEDMKGLTEMFYASVSGPAAVVNAPRGSQANSRIDPATGMYTREFMQAAQAAARGAVRPRNGGAK